MYCRFTFWEKNTTTNKKTRSDDDDDNKEKSAHTEDWVRFIKCANLDDSCAHMNIIWQCWETSFKWKLIKKREVFHLLLFLLFFIEKEKVLFGRLKSETKKSAARQRVWEEITLAVRSVGVDNRWWMVGCFTYTFAVYIFYGVDQVLITQYGMGYSITAVMKDAVQFCRDTTIKRFLDTL